MSSTNGDSIRREIISIRFTVKQVEMLEALAQEQDTSVSKLIRRAIGMVIFNEASDWKESKRGRRPRDRRTNTAAQATSCHPDRPYAAMGQCWACYRRDLRARDRVESLASV